MQDPQSLHKYLYVHGDPVNGADPTGLFSLAGAVSALGIGVNLRSSNSAAVVQTGVNAVSSWTAWTVAGAAFSRIGIETAAGVFPRKADATILSFTAGFQISLLPGPLASGLGHSETIELLWFDDDPRIYVFWAPSFVTFGTAGYSASAEMGKVWNIERAEDYTKHFVSVSASIGASFGTIGTFLRRGPLNKPLASMGVGGSATVFYDPTSIMTGAFGFSVGPAVGTSAGFGYVTSWTYYQLLPLTLYKPSLFGMGIPAPPESEDAGAMSEYVQNHGDDIKAIISGIL